MNKKENIVLDARIENVIASAAFGASLQNGHHFVAFVLRREEEKAGSIKSGEVVKVEFSPFDMSKGRILFERQVEK
jgi:translation initiation factor IF-1